MADEEPGVETGDIVMILRTADHETFERKSKFDQKVNNECCILTLEPS